MAFPDGYGADDLMSLGFVDAAQDFVFHGQTGRGKTHLAIAVGNACVQAGRCARFFTTAQLVLMLVKANRAHSLEPMLKDLGRADLLILDEFGYVPLDIEGAPAAPGHERLLREAERDRDDHIEFSRWGTVFGDDKLAAAIIDRLAHHGRLVEFNGASKRMDAALMLGKTEG